MLAWFLVALAALPRVGLVVRPQVVYAGHTIFIECRVPRWPDNRQLDMGLAGWAVSSRSLEGASAAVIYTQRLTAPCDPDLMAFCLLTTADGQTYRARSAVLVIGCE